MKVANFSKCHVIRFEISSFYQHKYMLKSFFSGAKLDIISKSDGLRYFPNDFLIKRLVFLHATKVVTWSTKNLHKLTYNHILF